MSVQVNTHVGFVDAGFLRALARASDRRRGGAPDPAACVRWLDRFGVRRETVSRLAHVYWYTATWRPDHREYADDLSYFRAIGEIPKLTVRLGTTVTQRQPWQAELRAALDALGVAHEDFERHMSLAPVRVQKGVDVLLAIDLVAIAARGAINTAVVIAGDADLVPAVDRARAEGVRVVLATPAGAGKSVAPALLRACDGQIEIDARASRELFGLP